MFFVQLDDIGDFGQQLQGNAIISRAVRQRRLQAGPGFGDEFVAVFLLMEIGGEEPEVAMGDAESAVAFVDASFAEDDGLLSEGQGFADRGPFLECHIAVRWEHVGSLTR